MKDLEILDSIIKEDPEGIEGFDYNKDTEKFRIFVYEESVYVQLKEQLKEFPNVHIVKGKRITHGRW